MPKFFRHFGIAEITWHSERHKYIWLSPRFSVTLPCIRNNPRAQTRKKTMTATIKSFDEVPKQFHLCVNAECPWRDTCLRQIAMRLLPDSEQRIRIINPNLTAHPEADTQGGAACPFYKPNRTITYARGFINMEEQMTVAQFRSYRAQFLAAYGKNPFYERRKGAIALSPQEQAFIRRMLISIGFTVDNPFDSIEERVDWTD